MRRLWAWILIGALGSLLVGLSFAYPRAMLSPGALVPAHAELGTQCFSCHAPFGGATSKRCIACHVVSDIGIRTTRGSRVKERPEKSISISFHQHLSEPDCTSCHRDHQPPIQARFSHDLLRAEVLGRCDACHTAPTDGLHRHATTSCLPCHSPERWKPSTFAHDQHFLLDRDHDASCATCHTGADFKLYTCYGCHEHTPAKIRVEHEKEAIDDFADCVGCHRSADHDEASKRAEHGKRRKDAKHGKPRKDAKRDQHDNHDEGHEEDER